MTNRLKFIGINTAGSAVRKVFPLWMEILGQDLDLDTVDIPLGAPAAKFRRAVEEIRDDPNVLGATITGHKTAIYETSKDLFAQISWPAQRLGEISVIVPGKEGLSGSVIEVESIGRTLVELGNEGQAITSDDADLVIYGAGGTASSLIACLTAEEWPAAARPRRTHVIDTDLTRLEHAKHLATSGDRPLIIETHRTTGSHDLSTLLPLPEGSLIVNATGLGKDRPGSPVIHPAPWPKKAQVWDLNYRGDLMFIDDAKTADPALGLHIIDGWQLFINGWAEGLSKIFDRTVDTPTRQEMSAAARAIR